LPCSGAPPRRHPRRPRSHDAAELAFQVKGSLPNSSELIPGKRSGTLSRRLTHRHFHNLLQSAAETQPPLIAFGTTTPSRSLAAGPLAVSARSHWVRRCRPTFLHCEGDETNLSVANSVTEFPGFRCDMEIPECVVCFYDILFSC